MATAQSFSLFCFDALTSMATMLPFWDCVMLMREHVVMAKMTRANNASPPSIVLQSKSARRRLVRRPFVAAL